MTSFSLDRNRCFIHKHTSTYPHVVHDIISIVFFFNLLLHSKLKLIDFNCRELVSGAEGINICVHFTVIVRFIDLIFYVKFSFWKFRVLIVSYSWYCLCAEWNVSFILLKKKPIFRLILLYKENAEKERNKQTKNRNINKKINLKKWLKIAWKIKSGNAKCQL